MRLIDKLSNGMVLDVNETGTEVFFQPGVLIGGNIDHECCKQRGIGYYLEVIFGLTPYFKKGLKITLKGVTNNEVSEIIADYFVYQKYVNYLTNVNLVCKIKTVIYILERSICRCIQNSGHSNFKTFPSD